MAPGVFEGVFAEMTPVILPVKSLLGVLQEFPKDSPGNCFLELLQITSRTPPEIPLKIHQAISPDIPIQNLPGMLSGNSITILFPEIQPEVHL